MGQPIVVTEKPSTANRGVVRFETNRVLTGMDHERYLAGAEIFGNRPPDVLARRLFEHEAVAGVHIHGNMVTIDLNRGYDSAGLAETIEYLYRFYPDPEAPEAEAAEPAEAEPEGEPAAEQADAADEPAVEEPAAVEPAAEESPVEEPAAEVAPEAPAEAAEEPASTDGD